MIGRILLIPILLLLVVAGLFLGGRNAQRVTLDYYFGVMETHLAVALTLALIIGICLGALAVYLGVVARLQLQLRRARKREHKLGKLDADRLTADG